MIGRQQFDIEVAGADAANRALAESKRRFDDVGTAGQAAGPKLKTLEDGLERVTGPAGKVLRVFNDVGDVFRLVTAGFAGGALFGGLQDIAEALGTLADKAGLTALRVQALAGSGNVLDEDLVKRAQGVSDLADGMERYAKALGVANAGMLTFRERQAGLRSIATGETKTREGVQNEASDLQDDLVAAERLLREFRADRTRFVREITAAGGETLFEAALTGRVGEIRDAIEQTNRAELGLIGRRGANPWMEAVEDYGRSLVARTRVAAGAAVDSIKSMGAAVALTFEVAQADADRARASAREAEQDAREAERRRAEDARMTQEVYSLIPGGQAGPAYQQPAPTMDKSQSNIVGPRQAGVEQAAALSRASDEAMKAQGALQAMAGSFKSSFDGVANTAMDAGGFVVGAVQQMSAAFGQAMTNFIISGEAGSGGIRKIAGNVLASLSAQAFGYAFMLEALAAASALTGVLAFAAPGVAAAGGIMAGAGVALGVTARMLGAEPIGGKGGRSGGGGGSASSAAGTNPYQPQGGGQTQVTVIIGSEVVTRGVHVEERRQAMRGGISEGRRAAA